ncbi:MAG: hypothetical protein K0Q91_1110 [Fibrobacteria bacterium]|nr:hypothetical protein [Fibrobacteria bacterium]
MTARDVLFRWLGARLDAPALEWLSGQCARLEAGAPDNVLHLAFGQAPRRAGEKRGAPLNASPAEQAEARAVHSGWDLHDWTVDQAMRAALLLSLPSDKKSASPDSMRAILALHQTADLGEHVALARALFLLPGAADAQHVAREAARSNMGDVFRAISQRNPYPAAHFDETAWNQMVAKCVFTDVPLRTVLGLDARANEALARMLLDLAQERKAAGRPLSPEAWRCIVPFSSFEREGDALVFLADMLAHGGAGARAAALALRNAPTASGRLLLSAAAPELLSLAEAGTLTWDNFDERL